jgi:hypothetical protein
VAVKFVDRLPAKALHLGRSEHPYELKESSMKTAGVVIDFYDDPVGAVLKKTFPTPDVLPESIKEAHILSPEERDVLRNDAFALVLRDEGRTFRKFACVDEGNTILSALYFEENADKLPAEAIKVAAKNIAAFCSDFGLEPTPFIKMAAEADKVKKAPATGSGKQRDPMAQPLVGDEADWASRTNLVSIRGGSDSGRVIPTANQMKTAAAGEGGTYKHLTPPTGADGTGGQTLTDDKKDNGPSKKNPAKLDTHDQSPKLHITKKPSDDVGGVEITGENGQDTDWPGKVANIVDVSGKNPEVFLQKTAAKNTALDGRYALDSYADVVKAIEYFNENWVDLQPSERHEYSVKTASRAEELGIEIPEMMGRYGSTSYSPDVEAHLSVRKANCDREFHGVYDTLKEKRASLDPDSFAELLGKADEASGLHWYYGNGQIFDPFASTFGGLSEKQAAAAWSWMSRVGDTINADQLKKVAQEGRGILKKSFSKEIVDALQADPFVIFDSLPEASKILISRLATEFDSMPTN